MTTECQYPQPKPSLAFCAVLVALGKYLGVNTSIPAREVCPDDLAWELEWAFKRWIDDALDKVYDEIEAIQKCVLANCPKILEAAEPPEDFAFEEDWAEQQQRRSQEEQE